MTLFFKFTRNVSRLSFYKNTYISPKKLLILQWSLSFFQKRITITNVSCLTAY